MSDSLCRLTVAACTDDTHRAIDLTLPADVQIGQFLPQIVEFVHHNTAATGERPRLALVEAGRYADG